MTSKRETSDVDVLALRGLSVCSGIAGIELGLQIALGSSYRTVCYVERETYAAATLVARMEEASLDRAPIWSDLHTFAGKPWRGVVDLVCGGVPCQPFSIGGKQQGVDDERWLWPAFWKVCKKTRAPYIFLENVTPIVQTGLPYILKDLAEGGFHAEWDCFQASALGAPHPRNRFFLFAYADSEGLERLRSQRKLVSHQGKRETSGTSWWATEPRIRRVDDGIAYRVERIRSLGNSVVPRLVATAWSELTERALAR